VAMLLSANVSYGQHIHATNNDVDVVIGNRNTGGDRIGGDRIDGDQIQGGYVEGDRIQGGYTEGDRIDGDYIDGSVGDVTNSTNVSIDNSQAIPAPLQNVSFIAPNYKTPLDISWTGSHYGTLLGKYSIPELCRVANPSKALGFLWYEWTKSFQIEMACKTKAKRTTSLIILPAGSNVPAGLEKMGEAHAKAVELHKSERQVSAALGVYATMQGATHMLVTSFSNPVTKTDSAVIGGAGASVSGDGTMINSAGGFGFATAEKVYRSYVVVELYR